MSQVAGFKDEAARKMLVEGITTFKKSGKRFAVPGRGICLTAWLTSD